MLIYLLKSGLCLGLLFLFYKILLERENMHHFKRFFLLYILPVSFLIPALIFTVNNDAFQDLFFFPLTSRNTTNFAIEKTVVLIEFSSVLLWIIYLFGLVIFSFRFGKNLVDIFIKIKKNEKITTSKYIYVLERRNINPHTFFNYIFLNKEEFNSGKIPYEVLLHEQAHARQKHSFDILFIEFFLVLFWFNPVIYLIKHSIKLNHEFLSDQAVLQQKVTISIYQNLLLTLSIKSNTPCMANAIDYSTLKKRFKIMKRHTSKKRILLLSLLSLFLTATLAIGFSKKKMVVKNTLPKTSNAFQQIKDTDSTKKKAKRGYITINNETHYYIIENNTTRYFTKFGEEVDKDGNKILQQKQEKQSGFIKINGKTHYYIIEGNKTRYFNQYGEKVDKNGEKI